MTETGIRFGENFTAAQILEHSVADIKAGLWVCGDLTLSCNLVQSQKPMGCAIGLLGINGGAAEIVKSQGDNEFEEGDIVEAFMNYPKDGGSDWSEEAKKTVEILASCIPKEFMEDHYLAARTLGEAQNAVVEYNDGGITTGEALVWFEAALQKAKAEEAKKAGD